jgi:amino acid adenylation domain-containing protein
MTPPERRLVTETWTRNERPRPIQHSLVSAFTAAAADHRDEVAFFDETQTLTFGELQRQATSLAARLAGRGVGRGDLVAVCLDRSPSFAAAVLGILLAGAAYVAFEPDDPAERVRLIVEDAKPAAIVCADELPWLGAQPARVPVVAPAEEPEDKAEFAGAPDVPPPDTVAFVVYTSGSQGEPKGVEISEAAVLNRLAWMWDTYPFAPDEVCCQRTPANFIDAGWELLGPLLQGVPSVVVPTSTVRNVPAFVDRLAAAGVTRLWLVPSLLRAMLDAVPDLAGILPKLTFWVSSGEALPAELFERFRRGMPNATLYNLYGTSEVWDATWWSPGAQVTGATVPIGRPIHNAEVYVVDRRLRPVPTGVPGELLVGGAGVGGGYLNRAQLTAERFIPNPLRPETEALVYRTGDRVRFLADGNVEYLGRSDRQVKVRGGRVELAEVEAAMLSFPGVRYALVVDRSGERGPWLAGYYVAAAAGTVQVDDLRAHLRRRVPEFMLPSAFVELAALPLSYNGKIDRSALPEPTVARTPRLPGTRWERHVADLWRDALGISDVSVNDNFFDIGGHSMLVIDVHTRLRRLVGNSLTVTDLFEHPTIAELARHCQALSEDATHVG